MNKPTCAVQHEIACASLRLSEIDIALKKTTQANLPQLQIELLRNAAQNAREHMEQAYSLIMASSHGDNSKTLLLMAPVLLISHDQTIGDESSLP